MTLLPSDSPAAHREADGLGGSGGGGGSSSGGAGVVRSIWAVEDSESEDSISEDSDDFIEKKTVKVVKRTSAPVEVPAGTISFRTNHVVTKPEGDVVKCELMEGLEDRFVRWGREVDIRAAKNSNVFEFLTFCGFGVLNEI